MNAKPSGAEKTIPAGLCGMLLGWLGVPKFSLGHRKRDIIQVIVSVATCGSAMIGPRPAGFLLLPAMAHAQFDRWPASAGGNGHYYEAVTSPGINWFDASHVATNKGGYLVTITSREENAFVYGMIRTNADLWEHRSTGNSWGPWIGGFQLPGSIEPGGGWSWITGEPFAYANWNVGEPNNDHGIEARVHFWGEQAAVGDVWNDKPASDSVKGFIIEYEAHPNAARLHLSIGNTREVQIIWPSHVNVHYTVQWLEAFEAFASTNWATLTNMVGTGDNCSAVDRISNIRRFYRVLSTP